MIEGRRAYQRLLEQLDPAIFWELDTYWATVAGCDAPAVVRELGARAPLLHLKDGPATPDAVKQALGTGVIDVPAIIAASAGSATASALVVTSTCAPASPSMKPSRSAG